MKEAIIMILAGILASPHLFTGKNKHVDEYIEKLKPAQGWIGAAIFAWGVFGVVTSILNLSWLSDAPILWIIILVIALLELVLGLLLGYNLLDQYVFSKNPKMAEKGKKVHANLVKKQTFFGVLGIIVGVLALVLMIVLKAA